MGCADVFAVRILQLETPNLTKSFGMRGPVLVDDKGERNVYEALSVRHNCF
jgi:hypothetical protein